MAALWTVEWVKSPRGQVAHARLVATHPGFDLHNAAGYVYCCGPHRAQVPIGQVLCQYGDTLPTNLHLAVDRLRRCEPCTDHLAGLHNALVRQVEGPLAALVLHNAQRGHPAAQAFLEAVLAPHPGQAEP